MDASGGIAISLSQTSSTYDLPKSDEQTANEPNTWIKADISSSTPKLSASTNKIPVTNREKLKPFEKIVLLAAGAVAVVAGIAGLANMSSGKSCSNLADELKPLGSDSSEFKRLINENIQKCGNEPGFLIEQAYLAGHEEIIAEHYSLSKDHFQSIQIMIMPLRHVRTLTSH